MNGKIRDFVLRELRLGNEWPKKKRIVAYTVPTVPTLHNRRRSSMTLEIGKQILLILKY